MLTGNEAIESLKNKLVDKLGSDFRELDEDSRKEARRKQAEHYRKLASAIVEWIAERGSDAVRITSGTGTASVTGTNVTINGGVGKIQ